jgi:hypothetical protein
MSLNLDFSLRRTFGVDADVEAGVETDVEADLCGSPSNLGVHALKRPPEGSGIFAKDLSKVLDVQLQLDRQVGAWSRCSVIVWLPNLSDRTPISRQRFRKASVLQVPFGIGRQKDHRRAVPGLPITCPLP